jgi:hypothetical protein
MTLSILQLNAIFNNKDILTLCENCGCIYGGDLCECRRIAAINSHYGGDHVERLYRIATMVGSTYRAARGAVNFFGEPTDVVSFAPSPIETGGEGVNYAISNHRNPWTF